MHTGAPPSLVIDGGALLFKQAQLPEREAKAAQRTAQGIAQITKALTTQAIGISPLELAGGIEFLQQLARENSLTFLSMNLFTDQGTKPLFPPYLLTQAGEMHIGILGLTGPLPVHQKNNGLRTRPWQDTLSKNLQEIKDKCDLIILLSSLPEKSNREIAEAFDNIHILLQSGQNSSNLTPVSINNTLLLRTAGRGKYAGVLNINWNATRTWGTTAPDQLQKEQNRLDRINWQIGRMKKRLSSTDRGDNTQYQQLLKQKTASEHAIEDIKKNTKQETDTPCSYENTFIALKTSLPEDKTIKAMVDQTRREVNRINRNSQLERKKKRGSGRTADKEIFPESLQEMAGWHVCRECHPQQVEFYLLTNHAKALQTLVDNDQQYNPDCLLCHVTLPTYNSKQVQRMDMLGNIPQQLENVSCEACHGQARSHTLHPETVRPGKPVVATCLQCHTDERDDNFVFPEKLLKVQCPAG